MTIKTLDEWPNCETADCDKKVCLWGSHTHCYPCEEQVEGRAEMRRRWEATHDEPWAEPPFPEGRGHVWNASRQRSALMPQQEKTP